jgi:integrase/recombinase XerD
MNRVEIEGGSTHSFRRTGLTQLSNAGIPLRVIQEISGHNNLEQLQKYLEVKPEQVRGAVAALSMISHAGMAEIVVEDYAEKSVVYIEKHIKD